MSNFVTYSGWAFSLLSIILSIFLYSRAKLIKRLELRQLKVSTISFPTNAQDYALVLKGKTIGDKLTRIELSLRNRGNTGIEKSDVRTEPTIEVEIENGELLSAYLAANGGEKPAGKIDLTQSGNNIRISLEYIDPKENHEIVLYTSGTYKSSKLKGHFKSGVAIRNCVEKELSDALGISLMVLIFLIMPWASGVISTQLAPLSASITSEFGLHLNGLYLQVAQGLISAIITIAALVGAIAFSVAITKFPDIAKKVVSQASHS